MKINSGQLHLLRLIEKDADGEGWAKVSKNVWPLTSSLPKDLVVLRETADGGFVRLTDEGEVVLKWS